LEGPLCGLILNSIIENTSCPYYFPQDSYVDSDRASRPALKPYLRKLRGNLNSVGFPDADFTKRVNDRKSVSGYVFMRDNGMIMWKSHTQNTVALSTKGAEYIALSEAPREAVARSQFLFELFIDHAPLTLLCDNTSAITIARNPAHYHRTKHIDID
jgi:hypothetical protein